LIIEKEIVKKPWGEYETHQCDEIDAVKLLSYNEGHRTSLQMHTKRDELLRIVSGVMKIQIEDVDIICDSSVRGGWIFIPRNMKHRATALEFSKVLEVMIGEYDEDDIIRYEDDYNRC